MSWEWATTQIYFLKIYRSISQLIITHTEGLFGISDGPSPLYLFLTFSSYHTSIIEDRIRGWDPIPSCKEDHICLSSY